MRNPAPGRTVIPAATLRRRIRELAAELRQELKNFDPVAIVLLEGARRFSEALFREWDRSFPRVYLRAQSYYGGAHSSGEASLGYFDPAAVEGRDALIIDDIYDTGRTLQAVIGAMHKSGARSVRTCVMLSKRRLHEAPVIIDYAGLEVDDLFLIGFGLDYQGKYRELEDIIAVTDLSRL